MMPLSEDCYSLITNLMFTQLDLLRQLNESHISPKYKKDNELYLCL